MVNTFLTYSNFNKSAQSLDRQRLGKQRVEAYQILCIIEDLALLSYIFQLPIPSNPYKYRDWIRKIANKYKQVNYYYFRRQNKLYKIPRKKPIRLKTNQKAIFNIDGTITVTTRKRVKLEPNDPEYTLSGKKKTRISTEITQYNSFEVIMPGDRCVSLGFVYHPAVLMWLGYSDALKEYIDAHIDEWVSRGYQNDMKRYGVTTKIHPIWTYDNEIHINHRAALLDKEKTRNEPEHYIHKTDFIDAGEFIDYIWPFNDIDNQRYIVVEKEGQRYITTKTL